MKDELKKLGNSSLRQFTGQLAQFQKVDADIVGSIVDKLSDLNEQDAKSLKGTFKDVFPELGATADADLNRTLAELLAERFPEEEGGKKDDGLKTDQEKVKEALDKILKEKEDKTAQEKKEAQEAADKAKDAFQKQLDSLLKAAELDKGKDDKKADDLGLGDIPPADAGAGDTGSGSGDGGGSGGGSGSGGGDTGNKTPTDTASKSKDTKTDTPSGLNLSNNKSESSKATTPKEEEPFTLESSKKKEAERPSTIQTGAKQPQPSGEVPQSDVIDPSAGLAPPAQMLAGSSSAASGVTPFQPSVADNGGGGSGAGIQINGASAPPSSGGDGDVFSGLGNPAPQPAEDRGRFFYQRTGDKDWVSSGGANVDADSGSDGSSETPSYGGSAKSAGPTLASLGIGMAREQSQGEARGVFSANPIKKVCGSSAGISVGVCSPRPVKATAQNQMRQAALPTRHLGSLFEKAKASGFIREAR